MNSETGATTLVGAWGCPSPISVTWVKATAANAKATMVEACILAVLIVFEKECFELVDGGIATGMCRRSECGLLLTRVTFIAWMGCELVGAGTGLK